MQRDVAERLKRTELKPTESRAAAAAAREEAAQLRGQAGALQTQITDLLQALKLRAALRTLTGPKNRSALSMPARIPANTFERLTVDTHAWITLRWTRGGCYYRAHLEQDLWTTWTVTQVNGRIGTPLGRARHVTQASIEAALFALADIAQRRRRRGYELTALN